METINGIRIVDCKSVRDKPLREIQETKDFKTFAEQFGSSLKLHGIVYLINTEIDNEVVANFQRKLAEFYSLPLCVKQAYRADVFGISEFGCWGWTGPSDDLTKEKYGRETFNFKTNPRMEEDYMYPKEVTGFKKAVLTFRDQFKSLNIKLLRCLSELLKLEDLDFFIRQHRAFEDDYEKSQCAVRTLYYPKEPHVVKNAVGLRLPEHQDFGTLTAISQSQAGGGLQAKLNTGEWVDVPYIPNSFVLFAGRSLEMYSGGNIPAVLHRVVWTDKSTTENRISFGFFVSPDTDMCVLSQVKENPNWKAVYRIMQPGETIDGYYKEQQRIILEKKRVRERETFLTMTENT